MREKQVLLRANVDWLKRHHPWLLFLLWVGEQVGCWQYYHGPHLMGDGTGYVAAARHLVATGTFVAGHAQLYSGYTAFLGIFLGLGLGLRAACLAQVMLSGLAAVALYATARRLTGGIWSLAALATFAFISWLDAQQFNAFILTESLFTSCLLFCLWAVARIRTRLDVVLALVLLLYTATIRPNGFIALAAAGLAGCWLLWQQGRRAWCGLGMLVLVTLGVFAINQVVAPFYLLPSYAAGDVIFHYPPTNVQPPTHLAMPSASGWPLMQLIWFVLHNPLYFSKLCALKALYFLGWPRPWYSALHKAWVVLVLLPLYAMAVVGFGRPLPITPIRIYLAAAILLQLAVIMLTTEDQNARFSAPLIAYWLQLAALGLQSLSKFPQRQDKVK